MDPQRHTHALVSTADKEDFEEAFLHRLWLVGHLQPVLKFRPQQAVPLPILDRLSFVQAHHFTLMQAYLFRVSQPVTTGTDRIMLDWYGQREVRDGEIRMVFSASTTPPPTTTCRPPCVRVRGAQHSPCVVLSGLTG